MTDKETAEGHVRNLRAMQTIGDDSIGIDMVADGVTLWNVIQDQAKAAAAFIEQQQVELDKLREQVSWQPIETAPKDREIILGRSVGGECPARVTEGYWYIEEHGKYLGDCGGPCRCPEYAEPCAPFWMSTDGGFTKEAPPTHWMPLPPEPQS